jgi:hypothetical protein
MRIKPVPVGAGHDLEERDYQGTYAELRSVKGKENVWASQGANVNTNRRILCMLERLCVNVSAGASKKRNKRVPMGTGKNWLAGCQ